MRSSEAPHQPAGRSRAAEGGARGRARARKRSSGRKPLGWRAAKAKRENAQKASEIKNFRTWLAELGRKCAEEERNAEEKASRIAELEKELTHAREAGARRADARERFDYVLACSGQAGSVPRSVLASAPESVLFKTFCGEWDYARDKEGRALITCHPERWAAILEHLATGAVPAERDPLLLEQARYWNLSRLVEGLEAKFPGVVLLENDESHFKVVGTFTNVMERFSTGQKGLSLSFSAVGGRWWVLKAYDHGIFVASERAPDMSEYKPITAVSFSWRVLLRTKELAHRQALEESLRVGLHWNRLGYSLHQMVSEPLARGHDSLVVELEVRCRNS